MEKSFYNVFIVSTEYHFILVMSIIIEHFSGDQYKNRLIFNGPRSGDININSLPENVSAVRITFNDKDFKSNIKDEITTKKIDNLFVAHTYRAYETYALSLASTNTKIHLYQDGALFYHTMEVSLVLNRLRETFMIYKNLWDKNIILKKIVYYKRHMHKSSFVNELWMTNPEIFVDPKTKLKINTIKLFTKNNSIKRFNDYFHTKKEEDYKEINNCLIYLAPIIRDMNFLSVEIEQIKRLKIKFNKERLIIKLHPGAKDKRHFNALKENFGNVVIQNYIPAEMYIANSTNSCVVGSASTALFMKNEFCENFALKKYYQKLGIYASWKNVTLPEHVISINEFDEFDKYLN